jgi:hypothetical protein
VRPRGRRSGDLDSPRGDLDLTWGDSFSGGWDNAAVEKVTHHPVGARPASIRTSRVMEAQAADPGCCWRRRKAAVRTGRCCGARPMRTSSRPRFEATLSAFDARARGSPGLAPCEEQSALGTNEAAFPTYRNTHKALATCRMKWHKERMEIRSRNGGAVTVTEASCARNVRVSPLHLRLRRSVRAPRGGHDCLRPGADPGALRAVTVEGA